MVWNKKKKKKIWDLKKTKIKQIINNNWEKKKKLRENQIEIENKILIENKTPLIDK